MCGIQFRISRSYRHGSVLSPSYSFLGLSGKINLTKNNNMNFRTWLNTFVDEKGLDRDQVIEAEGPIYGTNWIPLEALLETILRAPKHEQQGIKDMLVRIDFVNGDPMDYFKHLAQAIAK